MPANILERAIGLILLLPIIIVSLVAHELAHGYTSSLLGDPTPGQSGRLTANPLKHLDPVGTLVLIVGSLVGIGFGWARPVPVNPNYYREPRKGLFIVALAGPFTNLCLAALFGLAYRLAGDTGLLAQIILVNGVILNLGLCLFNLIPIPPLDGSRALFLFLRGRAYELFVRIQPYSLFFLVIIFFAMNPVMRVINIPLGFLFYLFTGRHLFLGQ